GFSNSAGNLLHLHFELLDANMKPLDPYGIYGITDQYPDPRGKNGKDAGKKNYFLTDPPQPFNFVPKGAKTPSATDAGAATLPPTNPPGSGAVASASPSISAPPSPAPTATIPPALSTVPPTHLPSSGGTGGTGDNDPGGGGGGG